MPSVTVPNTIGKGMQEVVDAGSECSLSSLRSSLLYYSIGNERLVEPWTRGHHGEAKPSDQRGVLGHSVLSIIREADKHEWSIFLECSTGT